MRRNRLLAPALAPLLAATLLLAGCGSDDDGDAKDDQSTSTSSEATSDEATEPTDDASSSAPTDGDTQVVTGAKSGVSFAVPADWEVLDPATAGDQLTDEGADYAKNLGLTDEQLAQALSQLDTLVFGPNRQNINAVPSPGTTLPTESQIRTQFSAGSVEVGEVEEVDTPVGPAVRASWTLPAGTGNRSGEGLWVVVDDSVVNIAATVADPELASDLVDTIVETLALP